MKKSYHNRLKELRIAKGFDSMRGFTNFISRELDFPVSYGFISQFENHIKENPSWRLIDVLCDYFEVSADYLMGKSDVNHYDRPVEPVTKITEVKSDFARIQLLTVDEGNKLKAIDGFKFKVLDDLLRKACQQKDISFYPQDYPEFNSYNQDSEDIEEATNSNFRFLWIPQIQLSVKENGSIKMNSIFSSITFSDGRFVVSVTDDVIKEHIKQIPSKLLLAKNYVHAFLLTFV